jgi:hypothetical protein
VEVGSITVDGRQVGVITQTDGILPEIVPVMLSVGEDTPIDGHGSSERGGRPEGGDHRHGRPHAHHGAPQEHQSHRHGPGHYERGEDRHKASGEDAGNIPYSGSGSPFDRARFAKELADKPWLREKIKHISLGENQDPRANAAVMETMMNRAVVRGTSLEAQAKRHRSSGVDEGGYYAGYAAHYSGEKGDMAERNLDRVLAGSNITNYATDNSSGDLAAREKASGAFKHHIDLGDRRHPESFFSPGHAEPALRDRWQTLNRRAQENKTATAKPFDPETDVP